MTRSRRAIYGLATDTVGQLLLTAVNLAVAPVILAYTSEAQYGFWLAALSTLTYLGLMDLGLGTALIRAVAGEAGAGNHGLINRLVCTAFATSCVASILFAGVGLLLSTQIAVWFNVPAAEADSVIMAFRIAIVANSLALPISIFNGLLCGLQKMALDNTTRTIAALIGIVVSLYLLLLDWGLVALSVSTLTTVIIQGAVTLWLVVRNFPELRLEIALISKTEYKTLLHFGGYFQLGRIANTVALNTDSIVISAALGSAQVTPYVFTSKLATLFSVSLASKLPTAAFPAVAEMYAQKDLNSLRSAFIRLSAYSTRLAVIGVVICILGNQDFVTLWVGESQFGGVALTAVFCLWIAQDTIYRGIVTYVYATDLVRPWALISIAEGVLNLGISIILVRSLGLLGVALGTLIAKSFTSAWAIPKMICRRIQLSVGIYSWQGILRPLLRSLPGVSVTIVGYNALPSDPSIWKLVALGALTISTNIVMFEGGPLLDRARNA
jgi:O-antigen/teichoic acid export membrane protein